MDKHVNVYDEASKRLWELKKAREEACFAIQKAPPGKIHIIPNHGGEQYYIRKSKDEVSGTYLSKTEHKKISLYVQKAYDEKLIKHLEKEILNLEKFLQHSENVVFTTQQLFSALPQIRKQYIKPFDCSEEDYRKRWCEVDFPRKPINPDFEYHKTDRGEFVRSKSELTIANMLYKHNIPYRYEYPVKLKNGVIVHPDFCVLDYRRREIFWEHRGMMDDRGYAKDAVQKLKDYQKVGIMVGVNLVITEETASTPLGTDEIERVIRYLQSGEV